MHASSARPKRLFHATGRLHDDLKKPTNDTTMEHLLNVYAKVRKVRRNFDITEIKHAAKYLWCVGQYIRSHALPLDGDGCCHLGATRV